MISRKTGERDQFFIIIPPDRNCVHFDVHPLFKRLPQRTQNLSDVTAPRQTGVNIRTEGINANVQRGDACELCLMDPVFQQNAVARHGNALDSRNFMKPLCQIQAASAHHRFPACQPDMLHTQSGHNPHQAQNLLKAQDLCMSDLTDTIFRHAIDTSQITSIRYGDTQIINAASCSVNHSHRPVIFCFSVLYFSVLYFSAGQSFDPYSILYTLSSKSVREHL